jgi:hypothetical protein
LGFRRTGAVAEANSAPTTPETMAEKLLTNGGIEK